MFRQGSSDILTESKAESRGRSPATEEGDQETVCQSGGENGEESPWKGVDVAQR